MFCFLWLFVMIRPTPESTRTAPLFPYTPLFRSPPHARVTVPLSGCPARSRVVGSADVGRCPGAPPGRRLDGVDPVWLMSDESARILTSDRKSTRLNSSH